MPKFYKTNLLSGSQEDQEFEEEDTIQTWLEWDAAARPFRRKNRSFYTTIIIIIVLVSAIAILAGQYLLIGAMLAFLFLIYVLNFVEPDIIHHKITTQGITIGDHFYHWNELDSFWISDKDGFKLLNILTNIRFPGVLVLVMGDVDEEQLKKICAKYLPFHEIAPTSMLDKWSDSLQKHFPLENPHK